jgi:Family of unknown function (DUF5343)
MPLAEVYVQTPAQVGEFFRQIRQGQAPSQFTRQHLKDLGFRSSNHHAFIPLLKVLGFLSADGQPTPRYHDYRNEALSRQVLGQALREAYGDLFVLRSSPTDADRSLLEGKFKSTHNASDRTAKLMASTFFALLGLADLSATGAARAATPAAETEKETPSRRNTHEDEERTSKTRRTATSLHYNIQIHLPATKDIEVYNAIFKSLKEHLVE